MLNAPKLYLDEYAARLNRVLDHIDAHLDELLSLEQLADVANFSAFHFHRIFQLALNETPAEYIRRRRLESAAAHLLCHPTHLSWISR